MQAQVKLVKPVDTPRESVMLPASEREFWVQLRHAKLMELAVIEKRLNIVRRQCRYCGNKTEVG